MCNCVLQIDLSTKVWNKWFQGNYRCIKLHWFPISAALSTDRRLHVLFFTDSFHGWPLGDWPPVFDLQLSGLQGHLPISRYNGSPCGGHCRCHRLLHFDTGGRTVGRPEIPRGDGQRKCDAGGEEYRHPGGSVHYDRSVLMPVTNNIVSKTVVWFVGIASSACLLKYNLKPWYV